MTESPPRPPVVVGTLEPKWVRLVTFTCEAVCKPGVEVKPPYNVIATNEVKDEK